MGPAITALIDGAASAIDLSGLSKRMRALPPDVAIATYWNATGEYLWRGVEAQKPLYEAQRPLFDPTAFE